MLFISFLLPGPAVAQTLTAVSVTPEVQSGTPTQVANPVGAQILAAYSKLPLRFEANRGQTEARVQFISRGPDYTVFLTSREAVLSLTKGRARRSLPDPPVPGAEVVSDPAPAVVRVQLVGGNRQPGVVHEEELPGKSNYFVGNDPAKWRTNVPSFAKVRYREVYPGIDLVYYGNQRQLEHDFVVAPGADPGRIRFRLRGVSKLRLNTGDLLMQTRRGELRLLKPEIYQMVAGKRHKVAGGYVLMGRNKVGFELAAFDRDQPVIIDPMLVYSTYLGGNNSDYGRAIALDSSGNAYLTGYVSSRNFPTTSGAYRTSKPNTDGWATVFVTKLAANGQVPVYSTYLGGSNNEDYGQAIAVDSSGNAYITGYATSSDFPTTAGAYQASKPNPYAVFPSAFVTKLAANGQSLVYSTYLAGPYVPYVSDPVDYGEGIAVDTNGNAYVTGYTESSAFPTTPGAYQTTRNGADTPFVTKLAANGQSLIYSTFLGGDVADYAEGIVVDSSGNAYVTGYTYSGNFPTTPGAFQTTKPSNAGYSNAYTTVFVTKLATDGQSLVYSTYLGGSNNDYGYGIAVDSSGHAYVTGSAASIDFPITAGAYETSKSSTTAYNTAFVSELAADGQSLVYSTYLGGSYYDQGRSIAVDSSGRAYVTGSAASSDFPTTKGAYQTSKPALSFYSSAFVSELAANGQSLLYSTYLGGSYDDHGYGIAVDSNSNAYVVGSTADMDFPTTAGAYQTASGGGDDVFFAKFNLTPYVATTTALTADANPQNAGQSVALTAYVSPTSGSATPAGTVTFNDGSTQIGQVTLDGTGHAALAISTLSLGLHSITATYSGNNSFTGSSSGTLPEQILPPMRTPHVVTLRVAATVFSTITISGMVDPNAGTTTYWFEYGTRMEKLSPTPQQTLAPAVVEAQVNAQLTGLLPDAIYHYRIVAQNSSGTSQGQILQFRVGGQKGGASGLSVDSTDSTETQSATGGGSPAVSATAQLAVNTGAKMTATAVTQTATLEVLPGRTRPLVVNVAGFSGAVQAATCTDLPPGVTCSYDESSQTLTITPSASTPPGSYHVGIVVAAAPETD
jgi:hypothetical protein